VIIGDSGAGLGVVLAVVAVEVGGVVGIGDIVGVVNRCGCPRPWTPICNVGTRDIPVINTIDNTITPNFDMLLGLRCLLLIKHRLYLLLKQ
jgi:hypothetical protein